MHLLNEPPAHLAGSLFLISATPFSTLATSFTSTAAVSTTICAATITLEPYMSPACDCAYSLYYNGVLVQISLLLFIHYLHFGFIAFNTGFRT